MIRKYEEENDVHFDIKWIEVKKHNNPDELAEEIQKNIDLITDADEILIMYGLCGNALLKIKPRKLPLVLLRAHDCCSILMGSKARFLEHFGHRLSQRWSCESYELEEMNNYIEKSLEFQKMVNEYGYDNAHYVYSLLYPKNEGKTVYISFDSDNDHKKILELSDNQIEIIKGDSSLIEKLLSDKVIDEVLKLYPGESIEPIYDHIEVISKTI